MTDITTKLRGMMVWNATANEAADEIDRLRAEVARLNDGNRKYAVALTKDQGAIDWRKWMLVPVTECEFIPKDKHDAEIARLMVALKSAAAFLTWCLEETPIGKPPEIGPDVLAKCRAALATVSESPK